MAICLIFVAICKILVKKKNIVINLIYLNNNKKIWVIHVAVVIQPKKKRIKTNINVNLAVLLQKKKKNVAGRRCVSFVNVVLENQQRIAVSSNQWRFTMSCYGKNPFIRETAKEKDSNAENNNNPAYPLMGEGGENYLSIL